MEQEWHLLPPELVQLISEKLISIFDFVRFRAVCPAWRSASSPCPRHLPPQLPWLILPPTSDEKEAGTLSMYDLSQSKTITINNPQIRGMCISGTSHGWLVVQKDGEVWLFNPITRDQISLPSPSAPGNLYTETHEVPTHTVGVIDYDGTYNIKRVILSSNPSMDPDCLVMAIFEENWLCSMCFCKLGDQCWTVLTYEHEEASDIIYHNGLFYAIYSSGYVCTYDLRNSSRKDLIPVFDGDPVIQFAHISIVEWGSDEHGLIILCWDYSSCPEYNPINLYGIYMLSDEKDEWLVAEEEHLNANIFFLGRGGNFHCISLPVADLKMDEWEGGCMCYISRKSMASGVDERIIGTCSIKLIEFEHMQERTLDSNLGCFDWDTARERSFLWLTPTLC